MQRLLGGDGDGVAGVDAHRVDVLDRADDDDVVGAVAHHLELELAPADHGLVEQHLADRRGLEALGDDPLELRVGAGDPAAAAAERVGGAHDAGQRRAPASASRAWRAWWRSTLWGIRRPASAMAARNSSRSSAQAMAS